MSASDLAATLLRDNKMCCAPHPDGDGKLLVGFTLSRDGDASVGPLVEALFALREIREAALAALALSEPLASGNPLTRIE